MPLILKGLIRICLEKILGGLLSLSKPVLFIVVYSVQTYKFLKTNYPPTLAFIPYS